MPPGPPPPPQQPPIGNRSPFLESRYAGLISHARVLLIAGLVIAPIFALTLLSLAAALGHNPRLFGAAGVLLTLVVIVPLFLVAVLPDEVDEERFNRNRGYVNVAVVAFMILTVGTFLLSAQLVLQKVPTKTPTVDDVINSGSGFAPSGGSSFNAPPGTPGSGISPGTSSSTSSTTGATSAGPSSRDRRR
jgi:hypothetical protein